jgi:general stress protein 26
MSEINNLRQEEAINKMKDLAEDINICLFRTEMQGNDAMSYRPMSTKKVDEEGNIWFFSGRNSDKNKAISRGDDGVQLLYAHPGKISFLIVTGKAEIVYDRSKVAELWNSLDKTWFKEGKDDPNISIIKVRPDNAHYWDTQGNMMINFFKMAASALTGKTLVKGEEGSLQPH